jgi:hypothetical protein
MIMSTASCNVGVQIRYALKNDMANVAAVLTEASEWLCERGMPMWKGDELLPERITNDVDLCTSRVSIASIKIQDHHMHSTPFLELSSALRRCFEWLRNVLILL